MEWRFGVALRFGGVLTVFGLTFTPLHLARAASDPENASQFLVLEESIRTRLIV